MPRQVSYNGTVHTFPDDASDDEIRQSLESSDQQQPSRYGLSDELQSQARDIKDVAVGAGKGVLSTAVGANKLLRKVPVVGQYLSASDQDMQQAQPYTEPTNSVQKIGKGIEQAGEFFIPGGAVSRGIKAVEAATKLPIARALGRAVLEAAGAAGVTGVQTGGDPKAMATVAATAGGTSAALSALPNKTAMARRLYGSALKPPPSMDAAERQAIIDTGLKEGVVLNRDVVDNVQARINALNQKISDEIATRSAAGATVNPETVAGYTQRSAKLAKTQVNPESDVVAVEGAKQEFLRNAPQAPYTKLRPTSDPDEATVFPFTPEGEGSTPLPIPLADAQRMKQGTYRKLKDSYGEQASAAREAQKDLARGLKDQIVQAFPEIAQLNANESALLNLEASLERFVGREGNKELIGLGTPVTTLAAHAAGAPVIPAALVGAALKSSEVKSRLAIALAKAAGQPSTVAAAAPKIAAYGVSRSGQPTTMPPPQP